VEGDFSVREVDAHRLHHAEPFALVVVKVAKADGLGRPGETGRFSGPKGKTFIEVKHQVTSDLIVAVGAAIGPMGGRGSEQKAGGRISPCCQNYLFGSDQIGLTVSQDFDLIDMSGPSPEGSDLAPVKQGGQARC